MHRRSTSYSPSLFFGPRSDYEKSFKLFTNFATPGWATTVLSTAAIFMVGITLMLLSNRAVPTVVPALDSGRFVDHRRDAPEGSRSEKLRQQNQPGGALT
jgi:hypothetical protein